MDNQTLSLNSSDLGQYITKHQIEAHILHLEAETPTVADAAAVVGVKPDQIVKSILFRADGEPVLVLANGFTRLSDKRLADHLGVARRRVRVANAGQVLALTGYPAGAVPPFGHRQPIPTIVEQRMLEQDEVYAGGGEIDALLWIRLAELQRIVGTETADLAESS